MKEYSKNPLSRRQSLILGLILCFFGICLCLYAVFHQPKNTPMPTDNKPTAPSTEVAITPVAPSDMPNALIDIPLDRLSAVHGIDNNHLKPIPSDHTSKDEWIHKDVYEPLMALLYAAKADGIKLHIVSAYRSYEHQKRIWERKWGNSADDDIQKARQNLEYSSFPGTSRHHWGTDVDFNSVSPAFWQSTEGQKIFAWLQKNAPRYGFCQTYGGNRHAGYHEEPWHWSHMPTANFYYLQIIEPEILAIALNQDVRGQAAVASLNTEILDYITGISPCQDNQENQAQP